MTEKKHDSSKRELIESNNDKRYVKRNKRGEFTENVDQTKSLRQDVKQHAKTKAKPGHGDEGDQPQKKTSDKKD